MMELAIQQAMAASERGEVPVGAVVVDSGTGVVIASAHNLTERQRDATAHAEVLAIRQAALSKGNAYLDECDMYVTLEPCHMCAAAIALARIRRLYFGAFDPKMGGVENGARLYSARFCLHVPEVFGGVREVECAGLLKEFFRSLRDG